MSIDKTPPIEEETEDSLLEIESLKKQLWAELEAEHVNREERAQRKSERRKNKHQQNKQRSKEMDEIRANLRREFYLQHGYEEKIDPTGRKMYLSPSELDNKRSRKKGKRSPKKNSITFADLLDGNRFGQFPVYLIVAGIAAFIALIVVQGS